MPSQGNKGMQLSMRTFHSPQRLPIHLSPFSPLHTGDQVSVTHLLLLFDKVQVLFDGPLAEVLQLLLPLRSVRGRQGLGVAGRDRLAAAIGGRSVLAGHIHRDNQL